MVSHGFGCGSEFEGKDNRTTQIFRKVLTIKLKGEPMPAIFGRVSSVVNWILRETRGGRFCS